jgi:gamma-glutamylputrescine oxidase
MSLQTTLPSSFYEASLAQPRVSYPTLTQDIASDVCVVGGGFMGLHTALNLQESGLKVVLLEANRIGFGASGRNGGHVIPEFGGSQRNFENHLDIESAKAIWSITHQAADHLRERITKYGIECDYQAGHIEVTMSAKHEKAQADWQSHVRKTYGYEYSTISHENLDFFVKSKRYHSGLLDKNGGHLHPLKLATGLANAFVIMGGEIFEQSPVKTWVSESSQVRVSTSEAEVKTGRLVLGCNVGMESIEGISAQKLAKRILPVGSWVIATEPLPKDLAKELIPSNAAVVDMRFILDYFRLSADHRMVFGGGCSYTGQEHPSNLKVVMRHKMLKVFPELVDFNIDYGWGGLIDISMNRMPDFGYADSSQRVLYAQGFSGSGIVATNAAARVLSEAISGDSKHLKMFQRIQHLPFPGGKSLRGPVTAAGMLYHRLLDCL